MTDKTSPQQKPHTQNNVSLSPETEEFVRSPQSAMMQLQQMRDGKLSNQTILALQRTIGNQRTRRMLGRQSLEPQAIQREAVTEQTSSAPPVMDLNGVFQRLMAGGYASKGQYTESNVDVEGSDKKQKAFERFVDNDLQFILALYMQMWAPNVPLKATSKKSGDSSGKAADHPPWVIEFQQKLMGQVAKGDKGAKPAPKPKPKPGEAPEANPMPAPMLVWDEASEGAQRLLEAYLNAWTVQTTATGSGSQRAASNVEEFIHNVGVSQTNNEAILLGGVRNSNDWCAISSGRAVALGLMRRGIRFKGTKPVGVTAKNGALGALLADLNTQAVRTNSWGGDHVSTSKDAKQKQKEEAGARRSAEDAGHVEKNSALTKALLKPGDRITIIYGGSVGPISGHVATVVKEELLVDQAKMDTLPENALISNVTVVSGNAAGVVQNEGAVRMESFTRIVTPVAYPELNGKMVSAANRYQYTLSPAFRAAERDWRADQKDEAKRTVMDAKKKEMSDFMANAEYPVSRDHAKFKPGIHSPKEASEGWVIAIMRTSMLDANALIEGGKPKTDELEKQGLEVFDEESLTKSNAGLNKLYPGALEQFD